MIFLETIRAFFQDREYRSLLLTTLLVLVVGTIAYHYLEGWSWLDAFYFSFISLTTIGFGDFAPATDAGKIFTILYVTAGVGIILTFINTVYQHYEKRRKQRKSFPSK